MLRRALAIEVCRECDQWRQSECPLFQMRNSPEVCRDCVVHVWLCAYVRALQRRRGERRCRALQGTLRCAEPVACGDSARLDGDANASAWWWCQRGVSGQPAAGCMRSMHVMCGLRREVAGQSAAVGRM